MTNKELETKIIPRRVDLGVIKDGEKVPYSIQNNSEFDIFGIWKSCGCIGEIKAGPRMIEGQLPGEYKEVGQELWLVDGQYCTKANTGQGTKYYNVVLNGWAENPTNVEGPIPARQFSQSITIKMKQEGVPDEIVDANGILADNPERLKIHVPISAWFIK